MAETGKHLHISIRAYRVAWCTSCIQDAEGVCAALTVYGGIQVRRGVRAGKKKTGVSPSRPPFTGHEQSERHRVGRGTVDAIPYYDLNYGWLFIVLARNKAPMTVAPVAWIAPMKASEDCPVVYISSMTRTFLPLKKPASICT